MSTPIPEDVMRAAREVAVNIGSDSLRNDTMTIARALMAEREAADERAAKIVIEWQKQLFEGERITWHAERVASAIRDRSKT